MLINMEKNRMTEDEILAREVSDDELSQATGGGSMGIPGCEAPSVMSNNVCSHNHDEGTPLDACLKEWQRSIYVPVFPNCAQTVEDGSWCGDNDACYSSAIDYQGMHVCAKAWK